MEVTTAAAFAWFAGAGFSGGFYRARFDDFCENGTFWVALLWPIALPVMLGYLVGLYVAKRGF